jgi:2-desacetyl-2-hydroxyethyl bacteriochlorophyllide A dehydrogenase
MKSIVLVSPEKGRVGLQELDVPEPGPNEVRVRTHASVVSAGTERAFVLGLDNAAAGFPFAPGYCTAGVVEAVGPRVTRFAGGERVAGTLLGHRACGNVPADQLVPISDGVSFEEAAFLPLGVIALQGVRKARIEIAEAALVLGLGIVGQLALQVARVGGAFPAVGADRVAGRRERAAACGADRVLDAADPAWRQQLWDATGGQGPPVVIEATGYPEAVGDAFQAAASFGRVVLLGSTRGASTVNFYRDVHRKGLTVVGAHILANAQQESRPGFWTWLDDGAAFMRLLQGGRIRLAPLVTTRVDWPELEGVYREVLAWNTDMLGIVVRWA